MIKAGEQAPDFSLPDQNNETIALKDLKGKKVVLYFYPKDNTPGCTREACDFRDMIGKFTKRDIVVLGVSPDSVVSHGKFSGKFELPFSILSDQGKKVADAYGVYKEKNMYGKKVMGIERTTFMIGPDGIIQKVFPKVKVDGHVEEVLASMP
jgi:peroxiredoxin Q/BCP